MVAGVLAQPSGCRAENPMLLYDTNMEGWGPDYVKRHPGVTMAQVEQFLTKMYKTPADFVWSVSRDGLASKSRNTPYHGMELRGRNRHTVFNGNVVVKEGVAQR